jgi:hypothetical protein
MASSRMTATCSTLQRIECEAGRYSHLGVELYFFLRFDTFVFTLVARSLGYIFGFETWALEFRSPILGLLCMVPSQGRAGIGL